MSEPVDVLDLVQRLRKVTTAFSSGEIGDMSWVELNAVADELFIQIETEVQRRAAAFAGMCGSAEAYREARDEALRQRDVARDVVDDRRALRTERDEALAEVEVLRKRERSLMESRDDWTRRTQAATAEVERLTLAFQQVCDAREGGVWLNGEIGDRLVAERDAALATVADLGERLAAATRAPGRTEQARTTSGDMVLQHIPCGWAHPWHPDATPDTGPDGDPIGCHKPGPWRPLLVATEPDPAAEALEDAHNRLRADLREARATHDDLIERLQSGMPESWGGEESAEWICEQYVREIERRLLAAGGSLEKHLHPFAEEAGVGGCIECGEPEDDPRHIPDPAAPLVLRLEEPPPGTVALVGLTTGKRYERFAVHEKQDGGYGYRDPEPEMGWMRLFAVLGFEPEGVRVEMAPPREPRTWPKLDDDDPPPAVVEVEGHGRWRYAYQSARVRLYQPEADWSETTAGYSGNFSRSKSLSYLRQLGDVREVFE